MISGWLNAERVPDTANNAAAENLSVPTEKKAQDNKVGRSWLLSPHSWPEKTEHIAKQKNQNVIFHSGKLLPSNPPSHSALLSSAWKHRKGRVWQNRPSISYFRSNATGPAATFYFHRGFLDQFELHVNHI